MEKQLSIIIPTYNMERYIGKCLDSLLVPEIDQLEIWVVNDGSKDRSSEIAHEYAARYPQSINVIDKENGNYGSCINTALPRCTGRYIKILDADDTFNSTALSQFLHLLPDITVDVLFTPYIVVDELGNCKNNHNYDNIKTLEINKSYTFEEAINSGFLEIIQMHEVTYSNDLFKDLNYYQTEGISFTDTQWASIPLSHSNSIRYLSIQPLYIYLLGREGQTMDPSIFDRQIFHHIILFNDRIDHMNNSNLSKIRKKFLFQRILRNIYYIYIQCIFNGSNDSISQLSKFDKELEFKNRELYEELACIKYHPLFKYYAIKEWRIKGYSVQLKIPSLLSLAISFAIRVLRIKSK